MVPALLLLCGFAVPALAGSFSGAWPKYQERIDREEIYKDKAWLALLHYRKNTLTSGWRSQADAANFFLSPDGKSDPRQELIAATQALFFDGAAGAELRCRFPARYVWLQRRLDLPGPDVLAACPSLQSWYAPLAADGISIDFASAYLENPSSMFGHTFLRLHRAGSPEILTPTINYAADSSRSTGVASFIVKGLVGGFPGIVDQKDYFRRLRTNSDDEGRDVWEYDLALDPDEIRMLLFHVWEIKEGVFDYYFLDENCSYRTLAMIDVARPGAGVLEPFTFDVVPVETIRELRNRKLIGEGRYRLSLPESLRRQSRTLSFAELTMVHDLVDGDITPQNLPAMESTERRKVLAAAWTYLSIRINRDQLDVDLRATIMHRLLMDMLRTDASTNVDAAPELPGPERSHSGHMVSVGWVDQGGIDGAELGVAGFRHDLVDPLPGYLPGAAVTVLGARGRVRADGGGEIEGIDLLHVSSLTPSGLLLHQPAWTVHLGALHKYIGDSRSLVGSLGYATGIAFDAGVGIFALTLGIDCDGGAPLHDGYGLEGRMGVRLNRQRVGYSYELYLDRSRYLAGEDSEQHDYGARLGVPLTRELTVELDFQRGGARKQENQTTVAFRHFF